MVFVITNGSLQERSTEAAREYVRAVRSRLEMEVARHGDDAVLTRSYHDLQRSIAAEELARIWPYADLESALAD